MDLNPKRACQLILLQLRTISTLCFKILTKYETLNVTLKGTDWVTDVVLPPEVIVWRLGETSDRFMRGTKCFSRRGHVCASREGLFIKQLNPPKTCALSYLSTRKAIPLKPPQQFPLKWPVFLLFSIFHLSCSFCRTNILKFPKELHKQVGGMCMG